jgi:GT2 family glycosyltransferase
MLSVIIPTCNRNDLLSQCLNCLDIAVKAIPAIDYEVIVTDDSKDNVAKGLIEEKYAWVNWIEGSKRGPAANRNNGAGIAKGVWLIFIDDDCLPQEGWLSAYVTAIQTNVNAVVLEGKTTAERDRQRFDEEAPINLDGGKLWSCNFAIKKDVFNQLNGFDETFPFAAMEDVDFHTRVNAHSPILFVPQAFVIHPWRRVKPFQNLKKHLKSQKHFAEKYGLINFNFRLIRLKIFITFFFKGFKELLHFSMKGWLVYIELCILNFLLIFL